ncbi:NAD(P)H-binding protein [Streptomyces roseicoloratus]|uniref:NmrA family NAD(P)-binding protein n=1 Tax=Streptomyces roseicoloratus TaxID=2508722 RepID=UPI001009CF09|nr:NAD(P)H-binding protein [Streptomyces roseicoloratus]
MSALVAVAGATGRIGRRVTGLLAEAGVPVRALGRDRAKLDRLPTGDTRTASYTADWSLCFGS